MTVEEKRLFEKISTKSQEGEVGLVNVHQKPASVSLLLPLEIGRTSQKKKYATKLRAIGIAFTGPTASATGCILDAPNFNIPDLHLIQQASFARNFRNRYLLTMTSILASLAKYRKGIAKGHENGLGIIIDTGIGDGIALNGQLYRGARNTAGEIGHLVLDVAAQSSVAVANLAVLRFSRAADL